MSTTTRRNTKQAMSALLQKHRSKLAIAKHLGINSAHISHYCQNKIVSPTLERALEAAGLIPPKPIRTRIAFECSIHNRNRIDQQCRELGMSRTHWLALAQTLLEIYLEENHEENNNRND